MKSLLLILVIFILSCSADAKRELSNTQEPSQPQQSVSGCDADNYPIIITDNELHGVYFSKLQLQSKLNKIGFQYCVTANYERIWNGFGPCLNLHGPSETPLGQENAEEYLRILDLANESQFCTTVKLLSGTIVRIQTKEAKFGPCLGIIETTPGNFSH